MTHKKNPSYISDKVHDMIEVPENIQPIIDTEEFQRLRYLKQLGATDYVFPGATHTRFEHSLGVMHLSRKVILHLKDRQPNLKITENEIFCVSAAGLLHDLGHGPFSHVFDHQFVCMNILCIYTSLCLISCVFMFFMNIQTIFGIDAVDARW